MFFQIFIYFTKRLKVIYLLNILLNIHILLQNKNHEEKILNPEKIHNNQKTHWDGFFWKKKTTGFCQHWISHASFSLLGGD